MCGFISISIAIQKKHAKGEMTIKCVYSGVQNKRLGFFSFFQSLESGILLLDSGTIINFGTFWVSSTLNLLYCIKRLVL